MSRGPSPEVTSHQYPESGPTPRLAHNTNAGMKITDAKVIVCSPGRNFVTLKLETEDGVYGLGDATLNGRELAVASYLTDHVLPAARSAAMRAASRTSGSYLYKGAYWRRGAGHDDRDCRRRHGALGHQGQGARTCRCINCSAAPRATGCSSTGTRAERRLTKRSRPWRDTPRSATRPSGRSAAFPASPHVYGVGTGGRTTSLPCRRPAARGARGAASATSPSCPVLFEALRRELGSGPPPAPRRASPADADRGGSARARPRAVPPVLDGRPAPAEDQERFRLIRQHTTTPMAVGEVFNSHLSTATA